MQILKLTLLIRTQNIRLEKDVCDNALINEFIQDYNRVDIDVYEQVLHQYQPSKADTDAKDGQFTECSRQLIR